MLTLPNSQPPTPLFPRHRRAPQVAVILAATATSLNAITCPSWRLYAGSTYSYKFSSLSAWWGHWTSAIVRQTTQVPAFSRVKSYVMIRLDDPLTMPVVQNNFQSNGFCQDTCKSNYAFAVILRSSCWCSNYAPSYNVNTLRCNDPCPGFPTEWCGSSSSGLYAYFQLSLAPSGTSARSSAAPSSTQQSSVSGSLTTEFPSMRTFPATPPPSSVSSAFEASASMSPVLTISTTQTSAQASTEQSTVTVTEQARSPSPSSTV